MSRRGTRATPCARPAGKVRGGVSHTPIPLLSTSFKQDPRGREQSSSTPRLELCRRKECSTTTLRQAWTPGAQQGIPRVEEGNTGRGVPEQPRSAAPRRAPRQVWHRKNSSDPGDWPRPLPPQRRVPQDGNLTDLRLPPVSRGPLQNSAERQRPGGGAGPRLQEADPPAAGADTAGRQLLLGARWDPGVAERITASASGPE
ncbi:hypothetical protein NDU88_011375 [Pleurodeles waltl]|uniref:Uncharacterized protein n=1 Tax=Pleurodeles waltl TaxID=8319 RepID=A0AAV7R2V8_PLEWA|nr:hypothetical protein NDU88_011375 [Pleurodeles waltl]